MNLDIFKQWIIEIEKQNSDINIQWNEILSKEIINKIINSSIYDRYYIYSSLYEKYFLKDNKKKAAFYTNLDIAYEMVKLSLENINIKDIKSKKIIDPCVWSWIFIVALIKYLDIDLQMNSIDRNNFIKENVFTLDIDIETSNFYLFLIDILFDIKDFKNHKIQSFFDETNKYDIIIWNPPYWLSLNTEKLKLINKHKKLKSLRSEISNDSYWLFYIHAFFLLKKEWNITFITPWSFLNTKQHYWLRKLIINDLNTIVLLHKDSFKNKITKLQPWIETVICKILKKENNTFSIIDNRNILYDNEKNFEINKENKKEFLKNDISKIYHIPISYDLNNELIDILTNKKYKLVKDYFYSAMGIKTTDNNKFTSSKKTDKFKDKFIKGTSKEKQEYICNIYDYIDIDSLIKNRPKNSNIPNNKFMDSKIYKIGIPEIWHKWIITAFKYKDEYVSNSIWIYILKEDIYNIDLLDNFVKLFNSKLYKDISKIYSNNIRLEKHVIDNLPVIWI